jgi:hypothetical protein
MMIHDAPVKIIPVEDDVHVTVSTTEQSLCKEYSSMRAATSEAIELELILPYEKELLDKSQPLPNSPHGLETKSDVDVAELLKCGFLSVRK